MGVGAGVQDDARSGKPGLLDEADELAFVVRLAEREANPAGRAGLEVGRDVVQGLQAVEAGLAAPEKVEVRAVDDDDRGHRHAMAFSALAAVEGGDRSDPAAARHGPARS